MKEEAVFWLGGKPGTQQAATAAPAAAELESTICDACRAEGLAPEDFVAALGGYGSWLVHYTTGGRRRRIVWNGRDRRLVLQEAIRSGGWSDLRDCAVAAADASGFVAAIPTLVREPAEPPPG